ncbi:MAG TPA: hypothetical protein VEY91_03375 [Candidatus Limnocylindria bacterium]|nr:hypothetical protein [Candidatus Limnocylindria bacterium]
MVGLQSRQAVLRDSLSGLLARDSVLALARGDSSAIAIAMSEKLIVTLIQETATRYLDRIEIKLDSDVDGHGEGEFEVDTPLGKVTVGEWKVEVAVNEMVGVLSALTPSVDVSDTNRFHLALPIRIREGRGVVTLDFKWDSNSIFNVVCRDFATRQVLQGSILPQTHIVRGDLILSAGERGIVADPEFPSEKFPLSMALDQASWDRVRAALGEQDKLLRCGLLVNPDSVIAKLRDLGIQGLRFRLPRAVFRTFVLPTSVTQSVRILNAPVELSVTPHQLRISPGTLWYSAEIEARRSEGPAVPLPLPAGPSGGAGP